MGMIARKAAALLALVAAHNSTRKCAQLASVAAFGSTTLVAGTKTVTVAGMTALSTVVLTLTVHGGTAGARYKVVPSAGQFIVTAVDAAGATVATDTSSFNYKVETPQYHADQTPATLTGDAAFPVTTNLSVTAANAVDLPTSITLANNLRQVMIIMLADAGAHLVADTTNTIAAAVASDLATTQTLLNDVKTKFNAHLGQAGVHLLNDTVNTVATANATDLSTSQALAIALKAAVNAHLASAPSGDSVTIINP